MAGCNSRVVPQKFHSVTDLLSHRPSGFSPPTHSPSFPFFPLPPPLPHLCLAYSTGNKTSTVIKKMFLCCVWSCLLATGISHFFTSARRSVTQPPSLPHYSCLPLVIWSRASRSKINLIFSSAFRPDMLDYIYFFSNSLKQSCQAVTVWVLD